MDFGGSFGFTVGGLICEFCCMFEIGIMVGTDGVGSFCKIDVRGICAGKGNCMELMLAKVILEDKRCVYYLQFVVEE